MPDKLLGYKRKWSMFIKWIFTICVIVVVVIVAYAICDNLGKIAKYEEAIANNETVIVSITFALMLLIALGYVMLSLYNILSHRAEEDGRMNCLPMIYSPIFLLLENGILHLFEKVAENGKYVISDSNYYPVTITVISAIAVGVITFASLKYAFEISSQRSRFIESAKAKPDIKVFKTKHDGFVADIKNNDCYLCGVYIGKIDKILYRDIKRTGNMFYMRKMFFPNEKFIYKKGKRQEIDFSRLLPCDIKCLCDYASIENQDIFLVFRDTLHYYYFVQLPYTEDEYNVIGANEYMVTRLLYKYNKWQYKFNKSKRLKSNNQCHTVKYESMDWFKIPYNFYPNSFYYFDIL